MECIQADIPVAQFPPHIALGMKVFLLHICELVTHSCTPVSLKMLCHIHMQWVYFGLNKDELTKNLCMHWPFSADWNTN